MRARGLLALLLTLLPVPLTGAVALNDRLQLITTPTLTLAGAEAATGTAFFYQQLSARDPARGQAPQWRAIEKVWLVTNRHVVMGTPGSERIPDELRFHLRRIVGAKLKWEVVSLDRASLLRRVRLHMNPMVDVAVVEVGDLLTDRLRSGGLLQWEAVTREDVAGENKIQVEVADDLVAIGYPRGFYDEENLYPIVKAGIVASKWGANFNGLPYFLIDAKLFPGSSGSLVISKPTGSVIENGQVFTAPTKQFAFLGVYSGEPFQATRPVEFGELVVVEKRTFNLGMVWYAGTIEETILSGVPPSVPPKR